MGRELDSADTNFKAGLKTEEKLLIAINHLAHGDVFHKAGGDWERGKSTASDCLYQVCNLLRNKF